MKRWEKHAHHPGEQQPSKKQSGFGLGGGGSFTSFYGTEGKKEESAASRGHGSSLAAGQDMAITASRDAVIVGSSLGAGHDLTINAGRDANILAGASTASYSKGSFSSEAIARKSDLSVLIRIQK